MKRLTTWVPLVLLIIMMALTGCGGSSSDKTQTAGSESVYDAGVPVPAVQYSQAATITLYQDKGDGNGLLLISNGDVIAGGTTARLGAKVEEPDDSTNSGARVFFSNGGGYQVEATQQDEFYVCDYKIANDSLLVPILVQVIYSNGSASKEKFVLRTFAGAKTDQLVRDGLGILIGKDILASASGMSLSGITINSLAPATASQRVLGAVLNVNNVIGLGLQDGITDGTTDTVSPTLKLALFGVIPIDMGPMTLDLADMIGGIAGDFGADLSDLDLANKPLFLDINGLPTGGTTDNVAAIALGLFLAKDAAQDADNKWVFPSGVTLYPNNPDTHSALNLDPDSDLGDSDQAKCLGVNLSMDNMSQMIGSLLEGSVTLGASSLPIPLAVPDYGTTSTVDQKMRISFKKEDIAFDFRYGTAELYLNDMRMEYLENNVAKWQMSLDLRFSLDVGTHTETVKDPSTNEDVVKSYLDIYLTFDKDSARCHVMKDDLGIAFFDHSDFPQLLVDALKGMLPADNGADLMASINMKDFGFVLSEASAKSGIDSGRCFLKMVMESSDLKDAGLCFISTASE